MNAATKIISDQIRMLQIFRNHVSWTQLFVNQDPNGSVAHSNGNGLEQHGAIWDTGIAKTVIATLPKPQARAMQ